MTAPVGIVQEDSDPTDPGAGSHDIDKIRCSSHQEQPFPVLVKSHQLVEDAEGGGNVIQPKAFEKKRNGKKIPVALFECVGDVLDLGKTIDDEGYCQQQHQRDNEFPHGGDYTGFPEKKTSHKKDICGRGM